MTAIPTSLVTGATNGIGLETARALARLGHKVVMVSRNPDKCRRVVEELRCDFSAGLRLPLIQRL